MGLANGDQPDRSRPPDAHSLEYFTDRGRNQGHRNYLPPPLTAMQTRLALIRRFSGLQKLLASLVCAVVVFLVLIPAGVDIKSRFILAWDVFCIVMVTLAAILFFSTSRSEVKDVVRSQDDGVEVIFLLVVTGVCFSLFGSLILLGVRGESSFNRYLHAIVSISPVVFSWILLHTIFSIRYAHLYHENTLPESGGLDFPGGKEPDYPDFAYFSFVIGMTFQVSDVEVGSSRIRRFVLLHSLISFVFNTVIVAMAINTIAGFVK
ncbi:MAG: DUF1345 domain-containing protein [Chitinophagaceae bacterium]|nr:MAG: DUF1345 domain-containing protein [Chitinophagaceae bacterium]